MAIRTKQIGRIANSVINTFLQNGQMPSVRSVISGIYTALAGRIAGTPRTVFTPAVPEAVTDPDTINILAETIADDVGVLYDESIDQVNRLVRDFDYKQTWRERLSQRMVALSSKFQLASIGSPQVLRQTIDSIAAVDAANTTAELNFRDYCVELPPALNRTTKVDLMGAGISTSTTGTVQATIGQQISVLSDESNTAYFVQTATSSSQASLTVRLQLAQTALLSRVVATVHAGAPVVATLHLDGELIASQPVNLSRRAVWDLPARSVTHIDITLTKTQPDGHSSAGNLFDFGLRNISAFNEAYLPEAVFTTAPLDLGGPMGTIDLSVDQLVPPNCAIGWAFSTTGPLGPFVSISPGSSVTYASATQIDHKVVMPARSTRDTVRVSLAGGNVIADVGLPVLAPVRGGRTALFTLCRIDEDITSGNVTVVRGRNAWKVSTYHYDIEKSGVISDPTPTLADFISPRSKNAVYSRFQPIESSLSTQFPGLSGPLSSALRLPAIEYPINSETDRSMHLFEATLSVDPTLAPSVLATLGTLQISVPAIFASGRASFYINGTHIPTTATTVAGSLQYYIVLPLQPGTNSLQIVTNNYISLGGGPFNIGTETLLPYLQSSALTWNAEPGPMTEVSLYELQYQTARNDFSRYARVQDPAGPDQLLVVRELPTTQYEVATTGRADTGAPTSVILQATLSGSSVQPSLTPKINSYQLTHTS